MKTKTVIFDFDDTLVATREIKWAHHKAVAKRFYEIDLTDEILGKHWGKPFDKMIAFLYENADTLEKMQAANRSIESEFPKTLYSHTLATVNKLLESELLLGILSSTNKEYVVTDMERLRFPVDKFFHIQGANETGVHKPNPAVFDVVIEKLAAEGINKSETVYVGDALMDWYAARDAGLRFVAVTTGLVNAEKFREEGVKIVINDIKQLPDLFKTT